MATHPFDLFGIPDLVEDDERDMAATVRQLLDDSVRPHLAQWYESGSLPVRELALTFGELGLLGMHLEGYGCAGTSASAISSLNPIGSTKGSKVVAMRPATE